MESHQAMAEGGLDEFNQFLLQVLDPTGISVGKINSRHLMQIRRQEDTLETWENLITLFCSIKCSYSIPLLGYAVPSEKC